MSLGDQGVGRGGGGGGGGPCPPPPPPLLPKQKFVPKNTFTDVFDISCDIVTSERTFSALKLLKNYLRSNMKQEFEQLTTDYWCIVTNRFWHARHFEDWK